MGYHYKSKSCKSAGPWSYERTTNIVKGHNNSNQIQAWERFSKILSCLGVQTPDGQAICSSGLSKQAFYKIVYCKVIFEISQYILLFFKKERKHAILFLASKKGTGFVWLPQTNGLLLELSNSNPIGSIWKTNKTYDIPNWDSCLSRTDLYKSSIF